MQASRRCFFDCGVNGASSLRSGSFRTQAASESYVGQRMSHWYANEKEGAKIGDWDWATGAFLILCKVNRKRRDIKHVVRRVRQLLTHERSIFIPDVRWKLPNLFSALNIWPTF